MEVKKENRGRNPVPALEKKTAVIIWVKKKHHNKATKDCKKVEAKYLKLQ